MSETNSLDQLAVNTIRTLSIDAIEKAKSGHPGLPLGAAPMAYVLWKEHLNFNHLSPDWFNRDRFVLSAGHGSSLLYSLIHLFGYNLSIEDLKNFRQWGSRTPGHPEYKHTPGVETTTGPLGQGAANGVGMAIAERMQANRYNKPNFNLIDHYTYVMVGDGDLMEGIAAESASLAGHLKLGKLIYLFDSNEITLDGPAKLSISEDILKRYEAYGWQVIEVEDGDNDLKSISNAIRSAKNEKEKPSLIIVKTTIGYGSPNKQGTSSSHGSPLGKKEVALTKKALKWEYEEDFYVPEQANKLFSDVAAKGALKDKAWRELFSEYSKKYNDLSDELLTAMNSSCTDCSDIEFPKFKTGQSVATRKSSSAVMNTIANSIPWFIGGDADLSCSTGTYLANLGSFDGSTGAGRNIHFGIREHAMAGIANGISYHGGLRPFTATFFSFVDYMRPSIRLAALTQIPVIYIFTHDSVAVGEDGPTHQPVEQLASVRAIPNLTVIRPSDATEVIEAWKYTMQYKDGPITLILSRQNIETIDREKFASASGLSKGAYILADSKNPELLLIATGSEVSIALEAYNDLSEKGISSRVISFPSWEIFEKQSDKYKESIFPDSITKRVSIEAGVSLGWSKYVGDNGISVSIDTFGASAPGEIVMKNFGFSKENLLNQIKQNFNLG